MSGTEMLSMYLWCFGIVGLITVIMMALGGAWESYTEKKDTDFLWVYDDLSVKSLEEDLEKTKDPVVANYIKKLLKQKKGG
jgi:hypothetical protein